MNLKKFLSGLAYSHVFALSMVLLLSIAVGMGVRFTRRPGAIVRELDTVKPGEMLRVEMWVYHSIYLFGYRLPYTSVEQRDIIGCTLHDFESGKKIGRYHDLGAKLCPQCGGFGEVSEIDYGKEELRIRKIEEAINGEDEDQ